MFLDLSKCLFLILKQVFLLFINIHVYNRAHLINFREKTKLNDIFNKGRVQMHLFSGTLLQIYVFCQFQKKHM